MTRLLSSCARCEYTNRETVGRMSIKSFDGQSLKFSKCPDMSKVVEEYPHRLELRGDITARYVCSCDLQDAADGFQHSN